MIGFLSEQTFLLADPLHSSSKIATATVNMSGFLSSQRLALQLASRHFREGYSGLFKHQCLLSKHTPLLKHENQVLRKSFFKENFFYSCCNLQLDSNWSSKYHAHRHCCTKNRKFRTPGRCCDQARPNGSLQRHPRGVIF